MSEVSVGDYVLISGGKWKGCKGVLEKIKPCFCLVEIKMDRKGNAIHTNKLSKAKVEFVSKCPPDPIEMPTMEDCVVVDNLPDSEEPQQNLLELIDEKMKENQSQKKITIKEEPVFLPQAQDDPNKVYEVDSDHEGSNPNQKYEAVKTAKSFMVHENGVKEVALTMDEAYSIRDERDMLKHQVQSMLGFQASACKEIAELKCKLDKVKDELYWKHKELEDACNHYEHNKLEKIREILDAS